MNIYSLRRHLVTALILVVPAALSGCAGPGKAGSGEAVAKLAAPPAATVSVKGATLSVIPADNGEFIVQGNNVDDIAGFDLTITYDSAIFSAPTVTKSVGSADAMMAANTTTPGTIRFVMISTKPFSGTIPLARVSFATVKGQGSIAITKVSMVTSKGVMVQ